MDISVRPHFYRTQQGAEHDLVLVRGLAIAGIEIKFSSAPVLSKGFYYAIDDLSVPVSYIITPESATYKIDKNIIVCSLEHFLSKEIPKILSKRKP